MKPCTLDLVDMALAESRRDSAMRIAEAHADTVAPGWPFLAARYLARAMREMQRFQTTDFRKWAELRGLPSPPDARAYGGVIRRAAKAGKLVADGYACKADAQAHACPAVVWKVIV